MQPGMRRAGLPGGKRKVDANRPTICREERKWWSRRVKMREAPCDPRRKEHRGQTPRINSSHLRENR